MGFCFVNNVLVAAAHAHLEHGIDRVIILDIDLHHGNGTQEAAMRINADTYREELLLAAGKPATGGVDPRTGKERRGLKICYLSIHDIVSILPSSSSSFYVVTLAGILSFTCRMLADVEKKLIMLQSSSFPALCLISTRSLAKTAISTESKKLPSTSPLTANTC
jgi:hypothetical protein